jgi:creatinine amidohydrolase
MVSAEVAETDRLLVFPLGATEQHGPHLPLGTDTTIAIALADRLAAVRDCKRLL